MQQITLDDLLARQGTIEDKEGKCEYCMWLYNSFCPHCSEKFRYPNAQCENNKDWLPDPLKLYGLCGGCKYGNPSEYEGDDFEHPIENENIYCEHPEGSLNRRQPFKKYWWHRFGVNTWDRQHEFASCARFEPNPE